MSRCLGAAELSCVSLQQCQLSSHGAATPSHHSQCCPVFRHLVLCPTTIMHSGAWEQGALQPSLCVTQEAMSSSNRSVT
jgi:hypothetical protein